MNNQRPLEHRNVYKETENHPYRSESDAIAEGRTCDIARFTALVHTVLY